MMSSIDAQAEVPGLSEIEALLSKSQQAIKTLGQGEAQIKLLGIISNRQLGGVKSEIDGRGLTPASQERYLAFIKRCEDEKRSLPRLSALAIAHSEVDNPDRAALFVEVFKRVLGTAGVKPTGKDNLHGLAAYVSRNLDTLAEQLEVPSDLGVAYYLPGPGKKSRFEDIKEPKAGVRRLLTKETVFGRDPEQGGWEAEKAGRGLSPELKQRYEEEMARQEKAVDDRKQKDIKRLTALARTYLSDDRLGQSEAFIKVLKRVLVAVEIDLKQEGQQLNLHPLAEYVGENLESLAKGFGIKLPEPRKAPPSPTPTPSPEPEPAPAPPSKPGKPARQSRQRRRTPPQPTARPAPRKPEPPEAAKKPKPVPEKPAPSAEKRETLSLREIGKRIARGEGVDINRNVIAEFRGGFNKSKTRETHARAEHKGGSPRGAGSIRSFERMFTSPVEDMILEEGLRTSENISRRAQFLARIELLLLRAVINRRGSETYSQLLDNLSQTTGFSPTDIVYSLDQYREVVLHNRDVAWGEEGELRTLKGMVAIEDGRQIPVAKILEGLIQQLVKAEPRNFGIAQFLTGRAENNLTDNLFDLLTGLHELATDRNTREAMRFTNII